MMLSLTSQTRARLLSSPVAAASGGEPKVELEGGGNIGLEGGGSLLLEAPVFYAEERREKKRRRPFRAALASALLLVALPVLAQDTKVSDMTAASALDGTELVYCVQSSADRKCTTAQVKTYADTNSVKEFQFPASALSGQMAPDDSFPAPGLDQGTNVDVLTLGYDDSTDECAGGSLVAPSDIDTSGTVTFRAVWYSGTATSGNIMWDFRHTGGQAEGVSWDTALTTEAAAADATQGTVDLETHTTWTETVSNLAWAASDHVSFLVCRDANHASDTLSGDASLLFVTVEVPRS